MIRAATGGWIEASMGEKVGVHGRRMSRFPQVLLLHRLTNGYVNVYGCAMCLCSLDPSMLLLHFVLVPRQSDPRVNYCVSVNDHVHATDLYSHDHSKLVPLLQIHNPCDHPQHHSSRRPLLSKRI